MDPMVEAYNRDFIVPAATEVSQMTFTPYTGERTQDLTGLQQNVISQYGTMVSDYTPQNLSAMRDQYTQSYMDTVLDPMRQRLARGQAQQNVGFEGDIIKSGAFGGARRGAYEAERDVAQGIEMANLEANIARDALSQASQQMQQDFGLRTGALTGAMAAGEAERAIGQERLMNAYSDYLAQQQFPLTKLSALTGGAAAFPSGIGTATGTQSDPLGTFGKVASGLGAFGSGGGFKGLIG